MSGTPAAAVAGDVEVRPMTPADAAGACALIVRCYGDAYPKRVMYRPDEVAELLRSRALSGVVAVAADTVVGHIGFTWPAPGATVVEAGTTVVDPRARGRGLMGRLALALAEALAAQGASGFVHFPTTAHTVMQRASVSAGGRETGLLLAYLPPETRDVALGAPDGGRLAVTVVYQPVVPAEAQNIHVPRCYAKLIAGMAEALELTRDAAGPPVEPAGTTRAETATDAARGLQRLTVRSIGADIGEVATAAATASPLLHIDLPMNDAGIDAAVERLREAGLAFAAWLPGWAGHDVLRLQHVAAPSDGELSPDLHSDAAKELLAVIRAELLGCA